MKRKKKKLELSHTISMPWSAHPDDCLRLDALRRSYGHSFGVGYRHAGYFDEQLKVWLLRDKAAIEEHVRCPSEDHVRSKLSAAGLPPRLSRSAAYEALQQRKLTPEGDACFGSKDEMVRRSKGLISREAIRRARLRPLYCIGEANMRGNQHLRINPADPTTAVIRVGKEKIELKLNPFRMKSKWAKIFAQVIKLADESKIALTFRLTDDELHLTYDPLLLPQHPERKGSVKPVVGRHLGIDSNPEAIGATVAMIGNNKPNVLEAKLFAIADEVGRSRLSSRQHLSEIARQTVVLASKHRVCAIVMEDLKNLKAMNGLLSRWARAYLGQSMRRQAGVARIPVIGVHCAYSTTIGNISFGLPDACAAATEIARRGEARARGDKGIFPEFDRKEALRGVVAATEARVMVRTRTKRTGTVDDASDLVADGWIDLHGKLRKADIGVRRPHPVRLREGRSSLAGVGALPVPRSLRRLTIFGPLTENLDTGEGYSK